MTPTAAERLPYVDEHTVEIAADRTTTWEALAQVAERSMSGGGAPRYARLIGCADTEAAGPRPLAVGSAFPGFHVAAAAPGEELDLLGSHNFSDYALTFRLEEPGPGRTRLRAETRAVFPGLKGGVYRGLVIGTRLHVLVTRRILGGVKRRAERG
ncbi:MAG: hypothetical protein QOE75_2658 [Solirubrobacterales bacterium]|jgi:hypothetical protein|nr:hypothetical protein [Solirubrobacterales bacterium]